MTVRFTLTLVVERATADGGATTRAIGAVIERGSLAPETLGLTLAEGKAILAGLQAAVVAEQVAAYEGASRPCPACGTARGIKDHRPITLDEMPAPDGPAYVGVDGGYVRDRAGSWFEVVAGKSVPGFRRDAPEDEPARPSKCFAYVQTHDDRPRRRLLDVLATQGHAPNQKLVLMPDGGESVRRLVARIGPEAEHVLDWFHVTMRLTVLTQVAKGACPSDAGWAEARLRDLERLKWLLWHGRAREAVDAAQGFADDTRCLEEDAAGDAKAKPAKPRAAAEEFATHLRRNAGRIVDYGERHRAGERISTGFVESAIDQVVSKRFSKRQSMRRTQQGAHLALQARTRVLNGDLEDALRRRWPGFQPSPKAEQEQARNGSLATPPPLATTSPVAPVL